MAFDMTDRLRSSLSGRQGSLGGRESKGGWDERKLWSTFAETL